ncbi:MAG: 30S ribosomal protein S18 [Chloroflexi bacterium]|nr:30S ribosomal protein S18 [Chloroflexota bacterium]
MTTQSHGGPSRQSGGRPPRRGRPRYYSRRKVCAFCVDHIKYVDYKDVDKLRRFLSDRFKIDARRRSGMCAKHQRGLALAIKRARHLALIPYSPEHRVPGAGYIA